MKKRRPKVFPYQIVLTRARGASHFLAQFVGESKPADQAMREAAALAEQLYKSGAYDEVRHVVAAVESCWGPEDVGGLFNGGHHAEHVAKGSVEEDDEA